MPIFELYSTRAKKSLSNGAQDVFIYDSVPLDLRVQFNQIFSDAIGPYNDGRTNNNEMWSEIERIIKKEHKIERLGTHYYTDERVRSYFKSLSDASLCLDIIEVCCVAVNSYIDTAEYELRALGIKQLPADALFEVNYRFKEAGIGYQFESKQIIRIDSTFIHAEVVKPALIILSDGRFSGPQEEYLEAHRHLRAGDYKDAAIWANKAFESTMRTICDIHSWEYKAGARASDLVKVLRAHGLWPDYLDASLDQLLATLASGLPKLRDNAGAHGQGSEKKAVPEYIASYAIHLAAAKIILLVKASAEQE